MNDDKTLISAVLALCQAELQNVQALVEAGFRELGLQQIDGVPIQKWIQDNRAKEIERVLLAMGDIDPGGHDAVRASIYEAMKKRGIA